MFLAALGRDVALGPGRSIRTKQTTERSGGRDPVKPTPHPSGTKAEEEEDDDDPWLLLFYLSIRDSLKVALRT